MSSQTAPAGTAAPVAAVASTLPSYTPIQQRIVGCLRVFLGEQAAPLYEAHGRSLQRLAAFARDSGLPGCQELSTGLALAQALLAEAMSSAPVARSPAHLGQLARAGRHALVRLAGDGGLASAEMVRRYAHLAADHLAPYAERLGRLRDGGCAIRGTNPSQRLEGKEKST